MLALLLFTFIVFLMLSVVYSKHKRKLEYWTNKNVAHLRPAPLFGNYKDYVLLRENPGVIVKRMCEKFPDEQYIGAFYGTEPVLIVQDPELIKLVITKDFYYFSGREGSAYTDCETGTQSVFFVCCDKWRILRQNLSPLFTTAKMKNMFHLIKKCSTVFEDMLEEKVSENPVVPINEVMAYFAIDCVGSCSFGIDTNVMSRPDNNPFYNIGTAIFEKSTYRGIKNVLHSLWPRMFYLLGFRFFPTEITNFFTILLTEVFKARQYKPSTRNDFVDLVLTLYNNSYIVGESIPDFNTGDVKKITMEVTNELLAAQCISFFGAGFETSATTTSLTLFELARNPAVQQRAIEDVDAYLLRHNNELDYDLVHEVPYLDACIDEALRFYPAVNALTRETMADYTFPTGLRIEKGTRIQIPVYYLQRHPKYFSNPEEFRPERFLGEEKLKVDPHVYMPFGGGPRLCVGMRFAKMQILSGLVTLLKNYRIELDPNNSKEVTFDPRVIVTHPRDPINVKLIPRKVK